MADYKILMKVSKLGVLNKQLLWRLRERQSREGSEVVQKPVRREWTHMAEALEERKQKWRICYGTLFRRS